MPGVAAAFGAKVRGGHIMHRMLGGARLRTKLVMLLMIPSLGLLWLAVDGAATRRPEAEQADHLTDLVQLSVRLGNLLHETQKERGTTSVFMSSNGARFGPELVEQRRVTDLRVKDLEDFLAVHRSQLPTDVRDRLAPALTTLAELPAWRQRVDAFGVPVRAVVEYITNINNALLDSVGALAWSADNPELGRMSMAYLLFLQAKEKAGLERANLAQVFGVDQFGEGQFYVVASTIAIQTSLLADFTLTAKPDVIAFYRERMNTPAVAAVAEMEQIALSKATAGHFGVDSVTWFNAMTVKINLMKEVEERQATDLLRRAETVRADAIRALTTSLLLAALLIGGTVAASAYVIRQITQPLRTSLAGLEHLAAGDLTVTVPITSNDEAGRIAAATNNTAHAMRVALQAFASTADRLVAAGSGLSATSATLTGTADGTNEQAAAVTDSAHQISASIARIAGAGQQTISSMREITENAATAATVARYAVIEAKRTTDAIEQLGQSSTEIGDVVRVITTIAEQTNLLALNATIEAARAGEAGRGFAIVAGEVKELARQTAQATQDVIDKITALQADAGSSRAAINLIRQTVEEINTTQATIADAVEEQLASTEYTNRSVTDVFTSSQDIATTIAAVAQAAGGTAASAGRTRVAADDLVSIAGQLRGLIAQFRY